MMVVKINNLLNLIVTLCCINNQKYLLLNDQDFLFIPLGIELIRVQSAYFFRFNKSVQNLFGPFLAQFNFLVKLQTLPLIKKLILKGLGLKVKIYKINGNKFLELKLGFSHLIKVIVPKYIYIKVNKTLIFISAKNKALLGNFLYHIHNLKKPNAYKGKGIWYKNEIKVLKAVKKV